MQTASLASQETSLFPDAVHDLFDCSCDLRRQPNTGIKPAALDTIHD
jgi:hypothetical protein